jgi:hypothetical protein
MCAILEHPIHEKNDKEVMWKSGKKLMSDVSFLKKLIARAVDGLSPAVIAALNGIIQDPNFDPAVLERAPKSAKSVCIFICSGVPYYEALDAYKAKNKVAEEVADNLTGLRAK